MIRCLLRLAYLKLSGSFHPDCFIYNDFIEFNLLTERYYFFDCHSKEKIFETKHVEFNRIEYKTDLVLAIEMGDDNKLKFSKILNILIKNKQVYLLSEALTIKYFEKQVYAYQVRQKDIPVTKEIHEIPDIHSCI